MRDISLDRKPPTSYPGPAMRRSSSILMFVLALSAFLAVGGGALLMFAGSDGAAGARRTRVSAEAAPSPAVATATATPAPGGPAEYPLVDGAPAITRPGMPGRLVIPSIS